MSKRSIFFILGLVTYNLTTPKPSAVGRGRKHFLGQVEDVELSIQLSGGGGLLCDVAERGGEQQRAALRRLEDRPFWLALQGSRKETLLEIPKFETNPFGHCRNMVMLWR